MSVEVIDYVYHLVHSTQRNFLCVFAIQNSSFRGLNRYTQRFFSTIDVHTPAQRSYNVSRVRSTDTKPELIVRKFFHAHGFRYRLHDKNLPGKPDVVLPKYKTVIFVHGCFYHGLEGCRYFVVPKTRTNWWLDKINGNKHRNAVNEAKLMAEGWKIITTFECELKPETKDATLQTSLKILQSNSQIGLCRGMIYGRESKQF